MVNNINIKKVCSFYVSDWHLATMLLPHLNGKINEEVKIATILQYSTEQYMRTLLEKLKIANKQKILNIDWKEKQINEKIIEEILNEKAKNIEIIVNGNMQYIEEANRALEKYILDNEEKILDKNIKIIDCYNVNEYKNEISKILEKHDKILNTSGEKEKTEYITSISIAN
jgi:hypothetical protein